MAGRIPYGSPSARRFRVHGRAARSPWRERAGQRQGSWCGDSESWPLARAANGQGVLVKILRLVSVAGKAASDPVVAVPGSVRNRRLLPEPAICLWLSALVASRADFGHRQHARKRLELIAFKWSRHRPAPPRATEVASAPGHPYSTMTWVAGRGSGPVPPYRNQRLVAGVRSCRATTSATSLDRSARQSKLCASE